MVSIDIDQLNRLFLRGNENPELVDDCYKKLCEYEYDGGQPKEIIDSVIRALKWIMQYEYANAEELKELAIREAAETAEKQAIWDEERERMKAELQTMIMGTNSSNFNEVFRTQIDSLRDENAYLKAQTRDLDRELADQSEKVERMSLRIEQLEKERSALVLQQTYLDDTIRELNRRLSNQKESSSKNEADASKLRQRNLQAIQLSRQLQELAQQNEALTAEVEQLTSALTSATEFIEETSQKYSELREQLIESDKVIEQLANDNEILTKQLEKGNGEIVEMESDQEHHTNDFQQILRRKDEEIDGLRERLESAQSCDEQEEQLEQLRLELVNATTVAKHLFAQAKQQKQQNVENVKHTEQNQQKFEQSHQMTELSDKLKRLQAHYEALLSNMKGKDAEISRLNAVLKNLRSEKFGDAEKELERLEVQLGYRERQIQKLTAKCSLLQLEISHPVVRPTSVSDHRSDKLVETAISLEAHNGLDEITGQKALQIITRDDNSQTDQGIDVRQQNPLKKRAVNSQPDDGTLSSWEASAVLISSLNHEIMLLIQELDEKDEQLKQLEKTASNAHAAIEKLKLKEVALVNVEQNFCRKCEQIDIEQLDAKLEQYSIQSDEYENLLMTLRLSGTEIERKLEEMHREAIAERLRNSQLARKLKIVCQNRSNENAELEKVKKELQEKTMINAKRLKIANYETDLATVEIARLQNALLNSVPQREYNELLLKFKKSLSSDSHVFNSIDQSVNDKTDELSINLFDENYNQGDHMELEAKNNHLKDLNGVLVSQNSYWQSECEKVLRQNAELRNFLEDVESESHMKGLVVALERRFLDALKCVAERSQVEMVDATHAQDLRQQLTRIRRKTSTERKHLITIISSLKKSLQRALANRLDHLSVDQVFDYKQKMGTIDEKCRLSEQCRAEAQQKVDELELKLVNVEAMRRSIETVELHDHSVIRLQKCLQADQLNLLTMSKELDSARAKVDQQTAQIVEQQATIECLKREIDDLYKSNLRIDEFQEFIIDSPNKVQPSVNELPSYLDNVETAIRDGEHFSDALINEVECNSSSDSESPSSDRIMVDDAEDTEELPEKKEFDKNLELTDDDEIKDVENRDNNLELSDDCHSSSDRDQPKSNQSDGFETAMSRSAISGIIKKYKKKIVSIRTTAEICIRNYKEQLISKEAAIEHYKEMVKELQRNSPAVSDEKELRDDPMFKDETGQLEAKELEVMKLKEELKVCEQTNSRLADQLNKIERMKANLSHCYTQTNSFRESNRTKLKSSSPEAVIDSAAVDCLDSAASSSNCSGSAVSQHDELRRQQVARVAAEAEVKKLKRRCAVLDTKNKQLQIACDTIRAEALAQIDRGYYGQQNGNGQGDMMVARLQEELVALKRECMEQRAVIRTQKETIERVQKSSEGKRNTIEGAESEEAVSRWLQRKSLEESNENLRKKLKRSEIGVRELRERLEKRDKRLEQLSRAERSHQLELELMRRQVAECRLEKDEGVVHASTVDQQLECLQQTISFLNQRINTLNKENRDLLRLAENKQHRQVNRPESSKCDKACGPSGYYPFHPDIRSADAIRVLKLKADNLDATTKKLASVELRYDRCRHELDKLHQKFKLQKFEYGAVAVLRDKLAAKERLIEQQSRRIDELEREKWHAVL